MGRLVYCFILIALMAAAVPRLAAAQPPFVPAPPYYAINPTKPLDPLTNTPVQQQILRNYRSRLLQTQRELRWQDPSRFTREQLEIRRQLDGFAPGFSPALPGPVSPYAACYP